MRWPSSQAAAGRHSSSSGSAVQDHACGAGATWASTGAQAAVLDDLGVAASGGSGVQVAFADGRRSGAEVVGVDAGIDIAVLRLRDPGGHPPLRSASRPTSTWATPCWPSGSPLGLSGTVTSGIINGRPGTAAGCGDHPDRAPINRGNSGGPLLDGAGRVIGVNTAIASLGSGNIGIGFAVPIDRAAATAERLLHGSTADRRPPPAGEHDPIGFMITVDDHLLVRPPAR